MIYFDHNASTPVRPEVVEAMRDALARVPANPSSAHRDGQQARAVVEHARAQVAGLVHAEPDEIVFTSGGTEGDHAGLIGAAWALESRGRAVAISAIEHHAVHGAAAVLARSGFATAHLPVDRDGRVSPESLDRLDAATTVVAGMLANNGTGVLQPVAEIAARARGRGLRLLCDAVQAAGKVPVDVAALGADYLVISGHKFGGPKGAGALVVRGGAPLEPLFRGTAHERGVEVSAGAACASGKVEPSPVLVAMDVPRDLAVCALRFSLGRATTAADVDAVVTATGEAVRAARAAGGRS